MSKDDSKSDLTSLPDVIAVSGDHKSSSLEVTVPATEIENSSDSQKHLSGDSPSTDKTDSSLSPETTSSGLSDEEDIPGASSDADVSSSSKGASIEDETPLAETAPKVRFASEVAEISASVASEDNEGGYGDDAVAGTSGESTQNAIQEEPENSVERSGDIANRSCCPEHRGFVEYFRISMMNLRESKYLLPFQFLVLAMPVSCGFMGSKYMEKCPASSAIPLLLFMIGILGTVVVCARIYAIFKKCLFPYSDWSRNVRSTLIAGLLMITMLYTAELGFFFTAKPTFSHGSDDYCDETFYYFVSYMNYISIALVIALLLLHCPGTNPCGLIYIPRVLRD